MRCEEAREHVSAYIDGELEPARHRLVGSHLAGCVDCRELAESFVRARRHARTLREPVPHGLAARVRSTLADADKSGMGAGVAPEAGAQPAKPIQHRLARPLGQAAVLAACCLLTMLATGALIADRNLIQTIERDVLAAHIRILLQDQPVQVATSDSHTVRPWFNGRVEFAPDVKDLAAQGFPLIGGRLDYVHGRRVAAIVYKRRLHVIDVFQWPKPAGGDAAPSLSTKDGYNILTWSLNGIAFWAVSDLGADELRQLQRLL